MTTADEYLHFADECMKWAREAKGKRMPAHKFRIGQMVTYRPAERGLDVPPGVYMIIARLPESDDDGQFEYRI